MTAHTSAPPESGAQTRGEQEMGIPMGPMGPMGIPWELDYVPCANGNGNENGNKLMGMGGNGNNCFSKIFPYSCIAHIAVSVSGPPPAMKSHILTFDDLYDPENTGHSTSNELSEYVNLRVPIHVNIVQLFSQTVSCS